GLLLLAGGCVAHALPRTAPAVQPASFCSVVDARNAKVIAQGRAAHPACANWINSAARCEGSWALEIEDIEVGPALTEPDECGPSLCAVKTKLVLANGSATVDAGMEQVGSYP